MPRLPRLRHLPVVALAAAFTAQAHAAVLAPTTLPTNLHYFATSGPGPVDPSVLVGFNPQPDPPGDNAMANLTNPFDPSIDQPGYSSYTILFGMHGPGGEPYSFQLPSGGPNSDGVYSFVVTGDGETFAATFHISGFNGDWVGFNPQPDPPGDFGDSFVGFSFTGDAKLTWNVQEETADGNVPLRFSQVPEPAGLGLLGIGLLGLVAIRRR